MIACTEAVHLLHTVVCMYEFVNSTGVLIMIGEMRILPILPSNVVRLQYTEYKVSRVEAASSEEAPAIGGMDLSSHNYSMYYIL